MLGQSGEYVGFPLLLGLPLINPHLLDRLTQRSLVAQNSDPAALARSSHHPAHRLLWVRSHRRRPASRPSGAAADAAPLPAGGPHPVALVGRPPGLISDPSFKATERSLSRVPTGCRGWVASLSAQIKSAAALASEGLAAPRLVNNADWMGQMSALDFLRDIGGTSPVNAMLAEISAPAPRPPDQGHLLYRSSPTPCCNPRTSPCSTCASAHPCGSAAATSGAASPAAWISPRRLHQTQVWRRCRSSPKADGTKFGKTEGRNLAGSGAHLPTPSTSSGSAPRTGCLPLPALLQLYAAGRDRPRWRRRMPSGRGAKLASRCWRTKADRAGARQGALAAVRRIGELLFSGDVTRLGRAISPSWRDGLPCSHIAGIW